LNFFSAIFGKPEKRAVEYTDFFGVSRSGSAPITADTAARLAPVFCAVRFASESIAAMPLRTVEKTTDNEREISDHWLTRLMANPCPFLSGMEFLETLLSHLELRGNGFAEIVRDSNGLPIALFPMRPGICRPERVGANVVYRVSTPDGVVEAPASRILHLKFSVLSADGVLGTDPCALLADDLNAARSARDHAKTFFENSASASGILQHPSILNAEAVDRLRRQFDERHSGTSKAGGTILLEDGCTWSGISVDNEKSQLLETRTFAVQDVSRIWRIPSHYLADPSKLSYASATAEAESLLKFSLLPRIKRIESALNRQLLSPVEQGIYSARFGIDSLLRGSTKERMETYQIGIQNSVITPAEARRLEDLPYRSEVDKFFSMPGAAPVEPNDGAATPATETET